MTTQNSGIVEFRRSSSPKTNGFRYDNFVAKFPLVDCRISCESYLPKKRTVLKQNSFSTQNSVAVTVDGPAKEFSDELLGDDDRWRSELNESILNSLEIHASSKDLQFNQLRQLQSHIFSYIYHGLPFFACGPRGSGKTMGYLMPIIQAVGSSQLKCKPAPFAIIVTDSDKKAGHIHNQFKILTKASASVVCTFVQPGVFTQPNNPMHILLGNVATVLEYIRAKRVRMNLVSYLVIDECERMNAKSLGEESRYAKQLLRFHEAMQKYGPADRPLTCMISDFPEPLNVGTFSAEVINTFFYGSDSNVLEESPFSTIMRPPSPIDDSDRSIPMAVHISAKKNNGMHKFYALVAILKNILDEVRALKRAKKKCGRRTIVLVREKSVANYLAILLNDCSQIASNVLWLTSDCDLVTFENAAEKWRYAESEEGERADNVVLVANYGALQRIDAGYIENCVIYQLPPPSHFNNLMAIVIGLSANMRYRRISLFFDMDSDRDSVVKLVTLLHKHRQRIPKSLYEFYLYILAGETGNTPRLLAEYLHSCVEDA